MYRRYLVSGVLLVLVLAAGFSPAAAEFPAGKEFASYWEFNEGGVLSSTPDCISFTSTKMCSIAANKCGGYTVEEYDGINGVITTSLRNVEGNGRIDLKVFFERRGPGDTMNAMGQALNLVPFRVNISLDGHTFPGGGCTLAKAEELLGRPGNERTVVGSFAELRELLNE